MGGPGQGQTVDLGMTAPRKNFPETNKATNHDFTQQKRAPLGSIHRVFPCGKHELKSGTQTGHRKNRRFFFREIWPTKNPFLTGR